MARHFNFPAVDLLRLCDDDMHLMVSLYNDDAEKLQNENTQAQCDDVIKRLRGR